MDREQRMVDNEKLFREVNERVAELQADFSGPDPVWVCECGDESCFEKVPVSIEEYQRIRSHEDWYVIRPGHDKPAVEHIVSENGSFVVVEKF